MLVCVNSLVLLPIYLLIPLTFFKLLPLTHGHHLLPGPQQNSLSSPLIHSDQRIKVIQAVSLLCLKLIAFLLLTINLDSPLWPLVAFWLLIIPTWPTYYLDKTTKLKYIFIIKESDQNVAVQMCVLPIWGSSLGSFIYTFCTAFATTFLGSSFGKSCQR